MRLAFLTTLIGCLLALSPAAIRAQHVSLKSGGFVRVSGHSAASAASSQSPNDTLLIANLNFGDVSPSAGRRRVVITVPIRISADTDYKLEIQRTGAGSSVKPSDIGFGIIGATAQTEAAGIQIAEDFAHDPTVAPIEDGVPRFQTTLAKILETPTLVLTGTATGAETKRLKKAGSILVNLTFVVVPQYFTPTTSSDNMSLLLTAAPLNP